MWPYPSINHVWNKCKQTTPNIVELISSYKNLFVKAHKMQNIQKSTSTGRFFFFFFFQLEAKQH